MVVVVAVVVVYEYFVPGTHQKDTSAYLVHIERTPQV